MKKILYNIFKLFNLLSFYSLKKSGYLYDKGWFNSFKTEEAIGKNNEPIPWMTYCFLDFIENRLNTKMIVFEFGCGNSTLWWSEKTIKVYAVESNFDWYDKMRVAIKNNVSLILQNGEINDYSNEILKYNNIFDIISIDGIDRVNCAKKSLSALKKSGVIIWDNSDRVEYKEGYDFLIDNGFKRLDFHGLGPINVMAWTTSVFYRENNCLGI